MYIKEIPKDAKQIKSSYDYVDPRGNIYGIERRKNGRTGQPFIKTQQTVYGYKYCGINYFNGRRTTKRVHRLVAEAFIANPNNYPIVMHLDNNKANNCVENLKWGTLQENTLAACRDRLMVNKKGYEDSQSIPCDCYDTLTNELVGKFGSVMIASKETGVSPCGILYQLKNPNQPIRKKLYFVQNGEEKRAHDIIIQYDYATDKEIARFTNMGQASAMTNIPDSTIIANIKLNRKPNWTKTKTYFLRKTIY